MVFKRVYNGTDKKKLRKIMKVVVLQSFVGKGFLGYHVQSKNIIRDNQLLIIKCMKSVKNWCNKNGYEYILNTKDLGWNYIKFQMKKEGFVYDEDREKDLCAQRHEVCLGIDADYIIIFDTDVWVYQDFELPEIKVGLCISTNALPHDNMAHYSNSHFHYVRKIMHGNIYYPQGGIQFINGHANKHYNEWIVNSIKSDNWPIIWDGTEQSHIYEYSRQYPEKITWLDSRYNCIPGRYLCETEEEQRNSYLIHLCGTNKRQTLNKLPFDIKERFLKL